RAAADANPRLQGAVFDRRVDHLVLQRRSNCALPTYRAALQQSGKQIQLFGEQRLIVVERIAEERERLCERPTPQNDLSSSIGDRVDRREALKYPHRLVRTQNRD